MMTATTFPAFQFALLAIAALGFASPAQALTSRAWVSGRGTDALTCGAPSAPCRSFQYVHDNIILPGGEIDVLEPGGYGAINITKAISIVNDGAGTAGVIQTMTGQNAITIMAGPSDTVHLRGLEIEGLGAAATGIFFKAGAALDISNCVVRHFKNAALYLAPNAGAKFTIADTIIADNGGGVLIAPMKSLSGAISRLRVMNNGNGVEVSGRNAPAGAAIFVSVADSVSANNAMGFLASSIAGSATPTLALSNVTATGNGFGVAVNRGNIGLSYSTVSGNGYGASISLGVVSSMKNNSFTDNGAKVAGGSLTLYAPD